MQLGGATWCDVAATERAGLLVIPVGSLEQHGPHLPLDTDTQIAVELATRLADTRADVMVAPAVAYGASGEHADFPGTLLINHAVLADLLVELVRSARASFAAIVVLSAHGGNREGLALLDQRCQADGDPVLVWSATVRGGDAHAGRTETSLMLAIDPEAVRLDLAAPGSTEPLEVLLPRLRAEGVRPISSNGVLGDPQGASAAEGESMLAAMTTALAEVLEARWPHREPSA
jgi:mycofactocin system creatininase family protein